MLVFHVAFLQAAVADVDAVWHTNHGEKVMDYLRDNHDGDEGDDSDREYDRARDERMERDSG